MAVAVAAFFLVRSLILLALKAAARAHDRAGEPLTGRKALVSIPRPLRRLHPRASAFLSQRLRLDTFKGLPLTLLVLAALYMASLLAGLTHEVLEADETLRFDEAVNARFAPWRQPPLIGVFLWITQLGSGPTLGAVAMTASLFLWAGRRQALIPPLWAAFLGAQLTTWAGKYAINRHRPEFLEGVTASSPSFPSGHATGAIAVYGFLAYAIAREVAGARQKFEVVYWSALLILLIGFSRMYLSVHYLTDVAAGFLVGGFWLAVALTAAEWRRRARS